MSTMRLIVLLSTAALFGGCAPEVIVVQTADELVAAIGPNRVVEIAGGDYDLSAVPQRKMEFVRWSKVHDGYELIVRNVSGMKLIGSAKAPTLLAKPRYANVLRFDGCSDIALENLVLGHAPAGYCEGGVVRMDNCRGVSIDKCDLFGCGIEGLTLGGVEGLRFSRSTIRDCTYGIMTISDSSDIVLSDSQFIGNREFGGFYFSDSRDIRLERCAIRDNKFDSLGAALFSAASCSGITVSGCTITGNVFKELMSPPGVVKIADSQVEDNSAPARSDR